MSTNIPPRFRALPRRVESPNGLRFPMTLERRSGTKISICRSPLAPASYDPSLNMKKWSFSLLLGVVYLGVFHLWTFSDRRGITISGLLATLLLGIAFAFALKRHYFLNRWDAVLHGAVILDLFLEAIFIKVHDHLGFYLCAAAFAIVVGGYRIYLNRKKTARVETN